MAWLSGSDSIFLFCCTKSRLSAAGLAANTKSSVPTCGDGSRGEGRGDSWNPIPRMNLSGYPDSTESQLGRGIPQGIEISGRKSPRNHRGGPNGIRTLLYSDIPRGYTGCLADISLSRCKEAVRRATKEGP